MDPLLLDSMERFVAAVPWKMDGGREVAAVLVLVDAVVVIVGKEEHFGLVAVEDDTPVAVAVSVAVAAAAAAARVVSVSPWAENAAFQSWEGRPKLVEHSPWSGEQGLNIYSKCL